MATVTVLSFDEWKRLNPKAAKQREDCRQCSGAAELAALQQRIEKLEAALKYIKRMGEGPEGEGHIFHEIAAAALGEK